MILFYRLTPAFVSFSAFGALAALILAPFSLFPLTLIGIVLLPLLFGRLLLWEIRRPGFWIFLGAPVIFFVSALLFFLLLEIDTQKWLLAFGTAAVLWVYTENLYLFYHEPARYQAYALEHFVSGMYVGALFLFGSAAFLSQIFMDIPAWLNAILLLLFGIVASLSSSWVGKMSYDVAWSYALLIGVVLAELYYVMSWLSLSFLPAAAVLSVTLMTLMSAARADMHGNVTRAMLLRQGGYYVVAVFLLFVTATWR